MQNASRYAKCRMPVATRNAECRMQNCGSLRSDYIRFSSSERVYTHKKVASSK